MWIKTLTIKVPDDVILVRQENSGKTQKNYLFVFTVNILIVCVLIVNKLIYQWSYLYIKT